MNKKLFLGMFAAAGMLFATSCSNDELDVVQSGNEAQVSFSLGLEGGIATRAISDGKSADVLMYAVFDKEGNRLKGIDAVTKTGVTFPTTENITLAKGQTYKVAFWAQDDDCEAYTVDTDKMSVAVDYAKAENKVNNDETRDAFFKTVEFTVTGSTSIDVEMKRPFAQINVGVTKADWDAAVASGITIAQSSVVIKNAATSLNLLDGTVEGSTEVSYALNAIPNDPAILKVDADGDGEVEEYNWLSMSYILPAAEQTGYEKATLENIAFVFAPEDANYSNIEFNQGLNNVPVQRNWRTNILGKLLTGDITFNIVIDPVYEDDHNVNVPYATINDKAYASFAEAMEAVQDGETIKLEGETTLEASNAHLFTIENKSVTIDLNGYGFVGKIPDITNHSSIFQVKKGGELTIQGEGNVKVNIGKTGNIISAFVYNNGGVVNLKGGNWTMTTYDNWQDALIPTFVDNSSNVNDATLNIYAGTYTFHRNIFRNHANSNSHVATMNIKGGTFNGRESDAGAIWNHKTSTSIKNGAGIINVEGGTFNNVVIDDDFAATATTTVSTDNVAVELSTTTVKVTVPASVAKSGDDYMIEVRNESTKTNSTTGETAVSFDLTMYKNDEKVSGGSTIYEVVWNVGAGKIISEVTHNGTALTKATTGADQTYTYDSATGDLTIYTASFSPFAITYADYKDYVRKLNAGHTTSSYISVSTGSDLLPIVVVNPEITGYSVFDGDTRITNTVYFRFSEIKKETINDNSYKVSVKLAIMDDKGNDLELKSGMPSTINGKEYLHVYMNLIEVPAGYSVSGVKVGSTSLTATQSGNHATGEYWVGSDTKDIYFQSKTAGLIEVTLTK